MNDKYYIYTGLTAYMLTPKQRVNRAKFFTRDGIPLWRFAVYDSKTAQTIHIHYCRADNLTGYYVDNGFPISRSFEMPKTREYAVSVIKKMCILNSRFPFVEVPFEIPKQNKSTILRTPDSTVIKKRRERKRPKKEVNNAVTFLLATE